MARKPRFILFPVSGTTVFTSPPAHLWGLGYSGGRGIVYPVFRISLIGFLVFVGWCMAWRRHHEEGRAGAESVLRERGGGGKIDETGCRQWLQVQRSGEPRNN